MKSTMVLIPAIISLLMVVCLSGCGQSDKSASTEIQLDAAAVPEHLRPALPMAMRFGFADGGFRDDALDRASPSELSELMRVVREYGDEIDRWLESFPPEVDMSDEAAAMMYMLLAYEELGL
ncbi:MAG: hypothetical protein EA418_12170 [Wenzhouxiangellaceae bacterium]|nr:MAG: hypothetical protein EA418_12170 [Wenzhouxiangellaceae bacterium]